MKIKPKLSHKTVRKRGKPVADFADLLGVFKTKKRFSKRLARAAYVKDLIAGKI